MNNLTTNNQSSNIVFEKKSSVFTNSMIISEKSENQHESVVRMITANMSDFEEYGQVEFTDFKSGKRGRPTRVYNLNQPQATLLMTFLDNSESVKKFKKDLVRAFFQMESFIKNLFEAKADFPEFTDAIMSVHEEPKHYHFSNELNMINQIVTGMTARQFKDVHRLENVNSIRPYLSHAELEAVKSLQRIDIGLIYSMPDYYERKRFLEGQFKRLRQKSISA
jgi:phage regulator Rha-like protein